MSTTDQLCNVNFINNLLNLVSGQVGDHPVPVHELDMIDYSNNIIVHARRRVAKSMVIGDTGPIKKHLELCRAVADLPLSGHIEVVDFVAALLYGSISAKIFQMNVGTEHYVMEKLSTVDGVLDIFTDIKTHVLLTGKGETKCEYDKVRELYFYEGASAESKVVGNFCLVLEMASQVRENFGINLRFLVFGIVDVWCVWCLKIL